MEGFMMFWFFQFSTSPHNERPDTSIGLWCGQSDGWRGVVRIDSHRLHNDIIFVFSVVSWRLIQSCSCSYYPLLKTLFEICIILHPCSYKPTSPALGFDALPLKDLLQTPKSAARSSAERNQNQFVWYLSRSKADHESSDDNFRQLVKRTSKQMRGQEKSAPRNVERPLWQGLLRLNYSELTTSKGSKAFRRNIEKTAAYAMEP